MTFVINREKDRVKTGVEARVGEAVIVFSYYPNRFTPKLEQALEAEASENYFIRVLTTILAGWDVKWDEKDAECAPVTAEVMQELPNEMLLEMMRAIGRAQAPNPTSTPNS